MPDGTVVTNVPDNITQTELMRRYSAAPSTAEKTPEEVPAKPNPQEDFARAAMSGGPFGMGYDVAVGAKQGLDALAQMAARATGLGAKQTEAEMAPKPTDESFGPSMARALGQSVWTAPLAAAKFVAGLPALMQGAGLGGVSGVLEPIYDAGNDFWSKKLEQATVGSVAGGATAGAAKVAGRVLAPKTSDAAKLLLKEDVIPAPGQIAGGAAQRIEDVGTGFPLLGDVIKSGQARGITDFNRAFYNRALAPIGEKYPKSGPIGREGIDKVATTLSDAYNEVLPKINLDLGAPGVGDNFMRSIMELKGMAQSLQPAQRETFNNVLQTQVLNKFTPGGKMTGETMKQVESELGRLATGYKNDASFENRQLGDAIRQVQANLREFVAASDPVNGPRVQAINKGFTTLTQIENAGAALGAKDGVFTGAQALNAVKAGDKTVRKNAFARGKALNQDLAEAGKSVLSQTMPETGARVIPALSMAGLLHATGMLPAAGVSALAYTPVGQKLMAGLLTKRTPQMMAAGQGLAELAPYLASPVVASGLLGPINQ